MNDSPIQEFREKRLEYERDKTDQECQNTILAALSLSPREETDLVESFVADLFYSDEQIYRSLDQLESGGKIEKKKDFYLLPGGKIDDASGSQTQLDSEIFNQILKEIKKSGTMRETILIEAVHVLFSDRKITKRKIGRLIAHLVKEGKIKQFSFSEQSFIAMPEVEIEIETET